MDYRNRVGIQAVWKRIFFTSYPKSKLHKGDQQMLANEGMKVQTYKCIKLCNPVIQYSDWISSMKSTYAWSWKLSSWHSLTVLQPHVSYPSDLHQLFGVIFPLHHSRAVWGRWGSLFMHHESHHFQGKCEMEYHLPLACALTCSTQSCLQTLYNILHVF